VDVEQKKNEVERWKNVGVLLVERRLAIISILRPQNSNSARSLTPLPPSFHLDVNIPARQEAKDAFA
jgi:hypothetical protein